MCAQGQDVAQGATVEAFNPNIPLAIVASEENYIYFKTLQDSLKNYTPQDVHYFQYSESVLDSINKGIENATEISRWKSGLWDVFVKRIYTQENIQEYGSNFPIEKTRGYMIRLKKRIEWQP